MRLRSTLVSIHLWLGISIGFLWALQGLTGALLVFSRDVERWSLHETASGSTLPLETLFARASAAAGAKVSKLEIFGPSPTLFVAYFEDHGRERSLVIDARSGAVKDRRDPNPKLPNGGSSWLWLQQLHSGLLLGDDTGGALIGISGIVLLSSLTLGAFLGWPRAKGWRAVVQIRRWRSTRQQLFGWHRLAGLALVAPLVIVAAGGAYLGLAPKLKPVLIAHAGYKAPYHAKAVAALPEHLISADQAFAAAQARYPAAKLVRIVRPTAKAPVYAFRLLQPGELRRWAGTTTVAVDAVTGRVLDTYDPLKGPLTNQVNDDLFPLHTGEMGGLAGRWLAVFAGLSLPTLYVTGLWARLHRRSMTGARR